ncbi:MAG: hypothetical protein ACRDJH_20430 [Thermomicrobiales bacterium]
MGILDRLLGRNRNRDRDDDRHPPPYASTRPAQRRSPEQMTDEQAVERYRYLLRTAPPETVEQAHAEAFAQLTPEQRQMVLQELSRELPEYEREAAARTGDDLRSLARVATHAEMQRPGTLERTFSGMARPGIGMGGLMMGGFFGSFAGMIVGGMVASQFFDDSGFDQGSAEASATGDEPSADHPADDASADTFDQGDTGDFGGDTGADFDFSGGDF